MKRLMLAASVLCLAGTAALADEKPSAEETAKIKAALEAIGCTSWEEIEKEKSKSSGHHFEVDDAMCKDGEFDIRLDKDFKITRKDPE